MNDLRQSDRRIYLSHFWRPALSHIARAQLALPHRDEGTWESRDEGSHFIFRLAAESGSLLMLGRIAKRPLCAACVEFLS